MKRSILAVSALTLALGLLAALPAHAGAAHADAADRTATSDMTAATAVHGFVGAWLLTVTPDPGPGAPPPFLAIITMGSDGNAQFIEGDEPTVTLGAWGQIAAHRATFNGYQFEFSSDFTGPVHVTATFDLQGSSRLAGTFHADFLNPDGSVAFSGGGGLAGTRILAGH